MERQLIFLDTEFTSFHAPELISIGLAASTGEEFYAEVPFEVASCSSFVREVVIPLLGQDPLAPCSHDELHMRLWNWLKVVKSCAEVVVCFDSVHDEALFRRIFDESPPAFLQFRNIGDRNINELLRYEFHVKNSCPEHQALNDACAIRYAFRDVPQPR